MGLPARYTLDWSGWQPGPEDGSPRLIKRQLENGKWVKVSHFADPLDDDGFWFAVENDGFWSSVQSDVELSACWCTESEIHSKVNTCAEKLGGWK